ncbi:MAG TPA: PEGA domain-containing protein [Myxococcales bacterium]
MERFGPYELIKKIATGGMAEIFLARKAGVEGFEKFLVLKRILPHLAENEEFVQMFLHEAKVAVRLNHPNIVTIHDLGKEDGAYFIAMEYIHGEDARKVWRQSETVAKPIPIPLVCRIVVDAAAGLSYAHRKSDSSGAPLNIIHRDVSPQNILVSFEGGVKVVDFGIAKAADQASQTRSGVLKGKYSYMSPEQAAGREIDQRTDQFALGTVLWELLVARRLFKRNTDVQTLAAVTECKVPNPWELNPRVPEELGRLCLKAMAKDPDERFADLHEMQMALDDWLVSNRLPSSPAHLASYMAELYSDRLALEASEGLPVFAEGQPQDPISSSMAGKAESKKSGKTDRRRTGLSNAMRKATGDGSPETRAARPSSGASKVPIRLDSPGQPDEPQDSEERTPVEQSSITGSSVSRLVNRLSGRKTTVGVAALAVVLGLAAVFVYQTQVSSTTQRPTGTEPVQPVDPKGTQPAAASGTIKVSTTPLGAAITLDATPTPERTPATLSGVSLGDHRVRLQLKGYRESTQTVTLGKDGETAAVSVELAQEQEQAAVARLTVESNPPGAEVLVDGKTLGHSPVTVELPAGGQVDVEVAKEGFHPKKQSVSLGEGGPLKVAFELEKRPGGAVERPTGPQFGNLVVTCDPPAAVWEGPKELGPTPLKVRLPSGKHQLVLVNRQEGLEYAFSVVLRPEDTVTKPYRFERGEVQVVVKPLTMDASIYLYKKKLGTNPLPRFPLLEGEYQLTVVNEELKKTKRVPVTVKRGELTKVVVNLTDD